MVDVNERVQYVRVTNGLDFDLTDRYDGVPVTIPAGKSENLPPDMAWHFFGYAPGQGRPEMSRHTAKRHGWNTSEFVKVDPVSRTTKADDYFARIKIEPVIYKLVPANDGDPGKPIPAESSAADGGPPDVEASPARETRMVPRRVSVSV